MTTPDLDPAGPEGTPDYATRLAHVQPKDLPPGVDIFDEARARAGARLNTAAYSLKNEAQRRLFKEDEARWMAQFGLTDEEAELIRQRDWIGMWRHGMSIYVMIKLCGVTNTSLVEIGRQMREAR